MSLGDYLLWLNRSPKGGLPNNLGGFKPGIRSFNIFCLAKEGLNAYIVRDASFLRTNRGSYTTLKASELIRAYLCDL